jgi:hypothetical protein
VGKEFLLCAICISRFCLFSSRVQDSLNAAAGTVEVEVVVDAASAAVVDTLLAADSVDAALRVVAEALGAVAEATMAAAAFTAAASATGSV